MVFKDTIDKYTTASTVPASYQSEKSDTSSYAPRIIVDVENATKELM